jgi:hypothetical protein
VTNRKNRNDDRLDGNWRWALTNFGDQACRTRERFDAPDSAICS